MTKRSNIYLLNTVKKILSQGIYLGAYTNRDKYLLDIANFFNDRGFCNAIHHGDEVIIESRDWTPILSIRIEQNTLLITPLEPATFFQSFLDTLEYVTTIGPTKDYNKKPAPKVENENKEDPDDSDDFEWI